MSPRGPSLALKSQQLPLKNLKKTQWFLMFLGPETSQETLKKPKSRPRDTQGPPKRHATKMPKKIPINASVVKIALSRRSHIRPLVGPRFGDFICLFLSSLLI